MTAPQDTTRSAGAMLRCAAPSDFHRPAAVTTYVTNVTFSPSASTRRATMTDQAPWSVFTSTVMAWPGCFTPTVPVPGSKLQSVRSEGSLPGTVTGAVPRSSSGIENPFSTCTRSPPARR